MGRRPALVRRGAKDLKHAPCYGRHPACDGDAGLCLAPLAHHAAGMSLSCVPTQAASDCAIDVMAYWDGV